MDSIRARELEETIQQLPGIKVARVSLENDQTIEKIHVLITPERAPKKVVRDIESFLLLRFGVKMDYRKISLVQAASETLQPTSRPRPRLLSADQHTHPDGHSVLVRLECDDRQYISSADGTATTDPVVTAAQATLNVIQSIVPGTPIRLVEARHLPFAGRSATMVGVLVGDDEELLGAAYLREDGVTSAARATLDALNRRFFAAW